MNSQAGVGVAVTNGAGHIASLHLWSRRPSRHHAGMADDAACGFLLEHGDKQLRWLDDVQRVRSDAVGLVIVPDAGVVADNMASVTDHYQNQVCCRWRERLSRVS